MQTKDLLPSQHGRHLSARFLITVALTLVLCAGTNARPAAASPSAAAVDNITGADDAGEVTTASPCAAAAPGYASCAGQILVTRQGHALIHPHLQRPRSAARTQVRSDPAALDPSPLTPTADGEPTAVTPFAAQADAEPVAAPLPQSGTPAFLQQAYDLGYLSETAGGGATVGVVDAYADPTAASDLAAYRSEYGLPACTTANGCLTIDDAGTTTTDQSWEGETALDLDAVSAICPNCHIVLVEVPSASLSNLHAGITTAHQAGAAYISNSWGEQGYALPDSGYSFSGATTFAAGGDSGYDGSTQYPAALPDVTAVGGTSLTYAPQTPRGYTEAAWKDSGSGCDTTQAKPTWQTNDDTGCTGRSYNDISADADPATGLDVYSSAYGGWVIYGGTSLATPITAAYSALVGSAGAGAAWPYQHSAGLNDVTGGSNANGGSCPSDPGICTAGIGFDGPTGNGTISGDVVSGAPGVGSNGYSAGVTGSSATVTVGVYPNGADTEVYLEYGASGQGYTAQTAAQSVGSGTQAAQATFELTGVATGDHYRVVAANSYGTTYGYDVSLASAAGWPSVTSASVTATSATTAEATYSVDYNGSGNVQIVYGPTTAYGLTASAGSGSGAATGSATLTGLTPGTTYHWATVITNGTETFTTPDGTFTTPAQAATAAPTPAPTPASSAGSGPTSAAPTGAGDNGPSGKGLKVVSVKGSHGRYAVKVSCRAPAGCAGSVDLIQRRSGTHVVQPLSGGRTRVIGTGDVSLKYGQSVTIRFVTRTKPSQATAVIARAGASTSKRRPGRR